MLPDVIEEIPSHLQIQNAQQREWLRFTTVHLNIGEGNLQIRGGGQVEPCEIDGVAYDQCTVATQEILDADGTVVDTHPAGVAFFHPEHNHWHQSAVATFELRESLDGEALRGGVKITFCFVDVEFIGETGARRRTIRAPTSSATARCRGWRRSGETATTSRRRCRSSTSPGCRTGSTTSPTRPTPTTTGANPSKTTTSRGCRIALSRKGANPKVTVLDHSECIVEAQCGSRGNP